MKKPTNEPTLDSEQIQILLQSDQPFPVDFEQAWQWSGYPTKRGALSKLTTDLVEGIHYISLKQQNSQQSGGRIITVFWLSIEGLKSLALMARTQKGREANAGLINSETKLKASICREWSEVITKISLAICLLSTPWMKRRRDRYLKILSTEHEQQIALFTRFAAVAPDDLQPLLELRATLKMLVS